MVASGGFRDAFIEVHVLPADLAGQQPRDGGFAAAHEAGQADERRGRGSVVIGGFCVENASINRRESVSFENVDCTIEGSEFDFGAAGIESAEERIAHISAEVMLVSGGSQFRFVVHFAFQGSGAQVERISGRKADFDHAAVILQPVNSVGQKFAVEKNVAGRGLRPARDSCANRAGGKLPLMEETSMRPAQRMHWNEPPTVFTVR